MEGAMMEQTAFNGLLADLAAEAEVVNQVSQNTGCRCRLATSGRGPG
jgi:hypothetical protein